MRRTTQLADPGREARERLADEVIETYVSWREACAAVDQTYADWCRSPRGERRLAHAVHVAAVDREESAAHTHREAVERVGRRLASSVRR
jgi:predicted lipoprotein